jgi:hypothetical protein
VPSLLLQFGETANAAQLRHPRSIEAGCDGRLLRGDGVKLALILVEDGVVEPAVKVAAFK